MFTTKELSALDLGTEATPTSPTTRSSTPANDRRRLFFVRAVGEALSPVRLERRPPCRGDNAASTLRARWRRA